MLMSDVNKFYISPMANNQWMNYKQQDAPMGKTQGEMLIPAASLINIIVWIILRNLVGSESYDMCLEANVSVVCIMCMMCKSCVFGVRSMVCM